MKEKKSWIVLLVLWCALLIVQGLSWYGILPFGRVHPAFIIVSSVGVGSTLSHLFSKD